MQVTKPWRGDWLPGWLLVGALALFLLWEVWVCVS